MASVTLAMGLRQKLQVSMTPAKTLAQALGEFCSKFDLDPSEYSLTHNKKHLDLALAWRLSGISANATLEVKMSASSSKSGTRDCESR
jgi:tether containing UBX domain for GLUT4